MANKIEMHYATHRGIHAVLHHVGAADLQATLSAEQRQQNIGLPPDVTCKWSEWHDPHEAQVGRGWMNQAIAASGTLDQKGMVWVDRR